MGCQISVPHYAMFMQSFQHLDAIQFEGFDRQAKVTPEAVQLVRQSWAKMLQPKPIIQTTSPSNILSPTSSSKSDVHSNNSQIIPPTNNSTEKVGLFQKRSSGRKIMSSPHTLFYNHFYGYLGQHHPDTEKIFAGSGGIKARADSLIRMISSAVTLATEPPQQSEESFRRCAAGHAVKGINVTQFAPVIDALIFSLNAMLDDAFTPTVKHAWLTVFSHAIVMMAPGMAPIKHEQSDRESQCPHSKKRQAFSPSHTATVAPLHVTSPIVSPRTASQTYPQSSDTHHRHLNPQSSASSDIRTGDSGD